MHSARSIVRLAGWGLAAGVVAAAVWAVVLLLNQPVNETDARVVLTSLGFAAASTTAASGIAAMLRPSQGLRVLGATTIGCSLAAFGLFTAVVWDLELWWDVPERLWRSAACAFVLAIALGHASLMLRGRRPTDGALVAIVTFLSLVCGAIDSGGALLPLAEIVDRVDESWARILGAVLVLLIATTVLAPLLRRLLAAPREPSKGTLAPLTR